jgi:hypothetical protein
MKLSNKSRTILAIFISSMVVLIYFFILHNNPKDRKIEVERKLNQIKEEQTFTLSQINIADNWDSALVIGPYNTAGADKIKMDDAVKSDIKSSAFGDEGHCTLIFEKGGELVTYAFVPRTNCADFSGLDNMQLHRDEKLCLTKKRIVKKE